MTNQTTPTRPHSFNLDPFGRHSDAEIWRALEDVQLKSMAPSLDMPVSEGGANLSTGQRQLLSLARAVLLRRRVLLMDEATASVDYDTASGAKKMRPDRLPIQQSLHNDICNPTPAKPTQDGLIQTTIRTAPAFRGCTLVVIAHRINTVLDSDLILVFHDGKCVEQGPPAQLRADPGSRFAAMAREAEGGRGAKSNSPNGSKPNSYSNLPLLVNGGGGGGGTSSSSASS